MELNNNDLNDNNLNNNDLNCPFKLYFHDPNSYNWDIESYIEICEVKTIEDFWISGENTFNDLAEDFGYSTQYVNGNWHWFNNGQSKEDIC